MKYLPLLIANLLRKKIRTTLSVGSFAVALFLFGLLAVVRGAFSQGVEVAGADRLVVINKVSLIQPLPLSYEGAPTADSRSKRGDVRELVRRRVSGRTQFLSPIRYRRAHVPRYVSRVFDTRGAVEGV